MVAAILVDSHDKVIAWACNTVGLKTSETYNPTLHAEMNLLETLTKNAHPIIKDGAHYKLYTTLKPCAMCSAAIKNSFSSSISIFYGQDDKSQHNTCLDKSSCKHKLFPLDGKQNNPKPIRLDSSDYQSSLYDLLGKTQRNLRKRSFNAAAGVKEQKENLDHAKAFLDRKRMKHSSAGSQHYKTCAEIERLLESVHLPSVL